MDEEAVMTLEQWLATGNTDVTATWEAAANEARIQEERRTAVIASRVESLFWEVNHNQEVSQ